jgi:thiol:disulfide interchange protein DsbC
MPNLYFESNSLESVVRAKQTLYLAFFMATISLAQEQQALTIEELAATLPGVEAQDIFVSPVPGMYEVAVGPQVAYVSDDGRYFIQGDLYDLDSNQNLTEQRRSQARTQVIENINPNSMIVFSPAPEEVKHTVTVFTDIDCGYCRQLHREMDQVNALGIAVRYVSYPRTGPDTDSWDKADRVWCAADRKTAFTEATLAGKVPEELCNTTPVASHYDFGHLAGVRGTPTILTDGGVQLGGYLPPQELFSQLEALVGQPQ